MAVGYTHSRYCDDRVALWGDGDCWGNLKDIESLFRNYLDFLDTACVPNTPGLFFKGHMPGDVVASFEVNGVKIGLVGLNGAWRKYADDDFEHRLTVDPRQLTRLVEREEFGGLEGFREGHDLCLLLQHHPPKWLEGADEAEGNHKQWLELVEPRFGLSLFGHSRTHSVEAIQNNGATTRRRVTAPSLFGRRRSKGGEERPFGCVWGQVRVEADQAHLRLWPRKLVESGEWSFRHPEDLGARVRDGVSLPPIPVGAARRATAPTAHKASDRPKTLSPTPNKDNAIGSYKEAFARSQREVNLLGFETRHKIALDITDIYVELQVQTSRQALQRHLEEEDGDGCELVLKGAGEDHEGFEDIVELPDVLRLAEETGRVGVVLLGEPGAGKTTLLKRLFVKVVDEGSESLGLPPGLVPVLLRFSHVRPEDRVRGGLSNVIRAELARERFPIAGGLLADRAYPLLFLLDGLDEMRDEETRIAVCQWLDGEVEAWPDARFVATCRFAAWGRDDLLSDRFLRADVLQMKEDIVKDFVGKWYGAVERRQGSRIVSANQSSAALLDELLDPGLSHFDSLKAMTRNPLLLSTLCLLHHSGGHLPKERGELYNKCISLLLELWNKAKGGVATDQTLPDQKGRRVLEPLAWEMHSRRTRCLSAEEVRDIIAEPISQTGLELTPNQFLDLAHRCCGVLAETDVDSYEFFHLSFQEYLSAAHVQEAGLQDDLALKLGDAEWDEVILLAMTLPGVFRPFMKAVIREGMLTDEHAALLRRCIQETSRVDPEPFLKLLSDGGDSGTISRVLHLFKEAKNARIETRARELMDTHEDMEVHNVAREFLGLQASEPESLPAPHPSEATRSWREPVSGIEFVWVPAGSFLMGSSRDRSHPLYDDTDPGSRWYKGELPGGEVELTQGYWIGRFPVTNDTYERFVITSDSNHRPETWSNPKFNHPQQPVVEVNWRDAAAFCAWLSSKGRLPEGYRVDLPTEAQWERAARGTDGRRFPWGSEPPDEFRACFRSTFPAHVGEYPQGVSPVGCHEMAGNVWEWCRDTWSDSLVAHMTNPVDPCHQDDSPLRVLRGGSWGFKAPLGLRCAYRVRDRASYRNLKVGFRVVCVVSSAR